MFDFEDAGQAKERADDVRRTCEILRFLDAPFLILIDDVYSNLWTVEPRVAERLDDAAWAQLIETTGGIADVAAEHGLRPVLHPHAETHVEYEDQIERFIAESDPRIGVCLDVGHHAYRGGDPVAFLRRHHERIPYLHLKTVDPEVQRRVEAERIPFASAVAIDMFVEPAKGVPDFLEVRDALADVGYDGFAIVEQDMYPAPFDKPFPIAKRTREYLREIGLG
jgi:inosose dehydratase